MPLNELRDLFLDGVLIVQGVLLLLCLIRSFIGPTVPDRLVAVNMVGTQTICIIGVLAFRLGASYLSDIGLIYAMVSFLAVVLLTKVYMGAYLEKKINRERAARGESEADNT